MKTEPIDVYRFLNEIKYKPKFLGRDLGDGVRVVCFRAHGMKDAHIEYPTEIPQRLYYEIINWDGVEEGEVVPLVSDKRIDVMYELITEENYKDVAKKINDSLHNLYTEKIAGK